MARVCCYVQREFSVLPFLAIVDEYGPWSTACHLILAPPLLSRRHLLPTGRRGKIFCLAEMRYCTETSLAKRTATKCYRFDNLWLLNEHYELFVLVPILYKPCHETATKHLSDFIKRPFSSDFFFLVLQNLLGIPDLKMGIHSWLFDFIFFPLHRWHYGISSYIMPFHFLLNWTLLEIFKFRYFFPHWQMSALAWFYVETSFVSIRFGLIYFSGNLTFNVFFYLQVIFFIVTEY